MAGVNYFLRVRQFYLSPLNRNNDPSDAMIVDVIGKRMAQVPSVAHVLAAAAATSPHHGHPQPGADQRPPERCGLPPAIQVQRITREELYMRAWREPIGRI